MTCHSVAPFVEDLADGALNESLSEIIQKHISGCTKCEINLSRTRRLKSLLESLTTPEPAENYFRDATELILARVTAESRMHRRVH